MPTHATLPGAQGGIDQDPAPDPAHRLARALVALKKPLRVITLTKLEEDFWASKTGQKLLRDRVERCFPEFIARAPGGMLSEVGLKRHDKTPEPVKMLRRPAPTVKAKRSVRGE